MPNDNVPEPEVSATAQRRMTAADVDINQVPDDGKCYAQCVSGPSGAKNNKVGQPEGDLNY